MEAKAPGQAPAELSTADRIAALNVQDEVQDTQVVSPELPDSQQNDLPHIVAEATPIVVEKPSVVSENVMTDHSTPSAITGITVEELLAAGIPRETAEKLTQSDLKQIGRLAKNHYVQKWNADKKKALSGDLASKNDAIKQGAEIQDIQANVPVHSIGITPAPEIKSLQVTKMTTLEEVAAKTANNEQAISTILGLLKANQVSPQNFTAPTPVAVSVQRVFPYELKDGKGNVKGINAMIAIEPLPSDIITFHNSALFSPGNIANLARMARKDPAEFLKNLEIAAEAAAPYQFKRK